MENNQIVSGQAVDNTLQLNKQGGGRIDIPLPESSLTTINISPVEINNVSSLNYSGSSSNTVFNTLDPVNIKIDLDDTIVEFNNTFRLFSLSEYSTARDGFFLRWSETEKIKEILTMANLNNLPDGDYYVSYLSLLNENTSGYGGTMRFSVSDNNITSTMDSLYIGVRNDNSEVPQKFKTYFYLIGKE